MPLRSHTASRPRRRAVTALSLIAIAALLAAIGVAPALARHSVHVHTAQNAKLGKKILVTAKGRTLYTLSAEKHGRFICTGTCLQSWHPLKVPAGAKVEGVAHLGTIKRPEGSRQATYRGLPLYTFDMDTKKGDVNGEGFKDVGTWHAAVAPAAKAKAKAPAPAPMPVY